MDPIFLGLLKLGEIFADGPGSDTESSRVVFDGVVEVMIPTFFQYPIVHPLVQKFRFKRRFFLKIFYNHLLFPTEFLFPLKFKSVFGQKGKLGFDLLAASFGETELVLVVYVAERQAFLRVEVSVKCYSVRACDSKKCHAIHFEGVNADNLTHDALVKNKSAGLHQAAP